MQGDKAKWNMADNPMHRNRNSFLNKLIGAKGEFVTMKLHFRYHTYLFTKKGGPVYDGCKYCQESLVSSNGKAADGNEK